MKKILVMICVLAGTVLPYPAYADGVKQMSPLGAQNRTRLMIPVSGNPTQLAVSAASNTNTGAPFSAGSVYSIVCNTDVYIAWGDAAVTASSSSGLLPQYTYMFWATNDSDVTTLLNTGKYVGVIRVSADGTCYIQQWI